MKNTIATRMCSTTLASLAIAAIATPPAPAGAQRPSFTIEEAMAAPFPTNLVAASTGNRVAWVFNDRGSRNVWIAERAANGSYQARALTRYAGDDGLEIENLSWSHQGNAVVFTRGGPANPRSLPLGSTPSQVWTMAVGDTAPRLLGDGGSPVMSPKGDAVALMARNEIVLQRLDGGRPVPLVRDRGRDGSLAWSPDGTRLAFSSNRGDHSLIGIYDLARKTLTWLDPSVDRDGEPIWSPDGQQVAFVRVPTGNPGPFSSTHTGEPWSIRIADAATGKGHALFTADTGAGSLFYSLEGNSAFSWGADNRIVFPWERTGWVHLYSIPVAGGTPTLLTPGDFEVFSADRSPDGREVVYSSNQNDLDHRRVWKVSVAGGTPTPLTAPLDVADMPVFTSDAGSVAFLHADARKPMRPAFVSLSGAPQVARAGVGQDLAPQSIPTNFPADKLIVPQDVVFHSPDGFVVHGQLFLPPASARNVRHPALLFFHGGPYRQMLLGWNPMGAYTYMYAENQYFASRGYVVLSVNYRGGTGYGMAFRTPPNFGPSGASEFNDVMGGANYLTSRPDVDAKRIGVWGGSYGGYLTALALARASNVFAAGVDYAGVHSWGQVLSVYASAGARTETENIASQSSPLSSIKDWKSPVLVIQADDDHNVPFDQSVQLMRGLRAQHVTSDLIVIPDEIHDLLMFRSWLTYFHAQSEFMDKYLGMNGAATH
jgi:dipeptidyl aminopeptidase/acylaminoacyl peptidase